MDRTAWIAIALATIGLVASIVWEQRQATEARVKFLQQQAILAAQATPTPRAANSPEPTASPNLPTQSLTDQKPREERPEQEETLKSDVAELSFSNNKGGLVTVGLLKHSAEQGHVVQLNTDRTPAIGAITQNPNNWQDGGYTLSTDPAAGTATLQRDMPGGLGITKVYTLAKEAGLKDDYQIRLFDYVSKTMGLPLLIPPVFLSVPAPPNRFTVPTGSTRLPLTGTGTANLIPFRSTALIRAKFSGSFKQAGRRKITPLPLTRSFGRG